MAAESVIHPVRQSHSRKALTPEEILKVLKIASGIETQSRHDSFGVSSRDAGQRSVRFAAFRFGFEKRANHHSAAQGEPHHNTAAHRSSRPTIALGKACPSGVACGTPRCQRFRVHFTKGRADSPLAIFPYVPVCCGTGGVASGSASSALPETRARIFPW